MINKQTFPHSPLKLFSFLLAALLFGLASYVLINLAKGYQFELDGLNLKFEKTGTIVLTSRPSGAQVTLDGKIVKKRSGSALFPTKIKGLLEGLYTLRLEKDGFISWGKKMRVDQELVSWADYIVLFPEEARRDLLVEDGRILHAKESPDLRRIAYVYENIKGQQELWYFDALSLNKTKLYSLDNLSTKEQASAISIEHMKWSTDSLRLLFTKKTGNKSELIVVNTHDIDNPVSISKTFQGISADLTWSPTDPSEFFWLNKGNLIKINISNETVTDPLTTNVISISATDNRKLYIVRSQNGERSLWSMNTDGNSLEKIVKSLPLSKNYNVKYSSASGDLLIIVNGEVRTVYLAKKVGEKLELKELSKDATDAFWSPDGEKILYINEQNAWTFDIEKEIEYQVVENSEVRSALWYMDNYHIAINEKGNYKILEFDGGNPISIGKSQLTDVFFSLEYKYLFYLNELEKNKNNIVIYHLR